MSDCIYIVFSVFFWFWILEPLLDYQVDKAYQDVRGTVQKRLEHCAYSTVDLSGMFSVFSQIKVEGGVEEGDDFPEEEEDLEDLD